MTGAQLEREALARDTDTDLLGHSEAVFNEDRTHRYLLVRRWGTGPPDAVFLMLNPSTATATEDDPTIRRCIRFARRERCNALVVVNLFGLRATDPRELTRHADPAGQRNDEFILQQCQRGSLVVAAWGAHGLLHGRGAEVAEMLTGHGVGLQCLGTTLTGQPRHPLYVRATAPLVPYPAS